LFDSIRDDETTMQRRPLGGAVIAADSSRAVSLGGGGTFSDDDHNNHDNNQVLPHRRRRRVWKQNKTAAMPYPPRMKLQSIKTLFTITTLTLFLFASGVWVVTKVYTLVSTVGSFSRTARRGGTHRRHYEVLPWNTRYRVPDASVVVGDRSDAYATLRHELDVLLPDDPVRSRDAVRALVASTPLYAPLPMDATHSDVVPYDIYDCPSTPPAGYPFAWNILTLLHHWPPDDTTTPRPTIHQGLCVFDYVKDLDKALTYRRAELPFVVVNDPAVQRTVERWNVPGYVDRLLGDVPHRCEFSENNHFMYYTPMGGKKQRRRNNNNNNNNGGRTRLGGARRNAVQVPEGWTEPTQQLRMSYRDWLAHANVTDEHLGPDRPHWYFRLIGCGYMGPEGTCDKGSSEYLFDELPFFQPRENLYIVDPDEQKGIHCRFGMKGVIAENHFDGSRNAIVVLGGSRRYILANPDQCNFLALFPKGHPSARHSAVDWSNPDLDAYPSFANALANEVVLQPGHVLYLPTNWFHYIVSLELNFQCNTRSGVSTEYMEPIHDCGF
jgi:hypothetical protein